MAELRFSAGFWEAFARLTPPERNCIRRALHFLAENFRHPSLRAKKWDDTDIWYARVTRDLRLYYEVDGDIYRVIDVGHHDIERQR